MHVGVGAIAHVLDDLDRFTQILVVAPFTLVALPIGLSLIATIEKDPKARRGLGGRLYGFLDGHEQEGADAVFAKKPTGAFNAAMMTEQIRLFKPFFFTDATKGMRIGIQSEADWLHTLKSMEEAKVIAPGSKPSDYFTNDCIDVAIVDKVASASY